MSRDRGQHPEPHGVPSCMVRGRPGQRILKPSRGQATPGKHVPVSGGYASRLCHPAPAGHRTRGDETLVCSVPRNRSLSSGSRGFLDHRASRSTQHSFLTKATEGAGGSRRQAASGQAKWLTSFHALRVSSVRLRGGPEDCSAPKLI